MKGALSITLDVFTPKSAKRPYHFRQVHQSQLSPPK
jgi:hypothetical protein